MSKQIDKRLYVITGPIGAGKTSAYKYLNRFFGFESYVFLCNDNHAEEIKRKTGREYSSCYDEAREITRKELNNARNQNLNVVWETVLVKEEKFEELQKFANRGYYITVVFVDVSDMDICLERVRFRQLRTGIVVKEEMIKRRYYESYLKIDRVSRVVDDFWILDNTPDVEGLSLVDFSANNLKRRNKEMYKMIAVDCDGTLLTSKKEISAESEKAIKLAKSKGVSIVIATARPFYRIKKYIEQAELTSENDYSILFNGGLVVKNKTGEVLYSNSMSEKEIHRLLQVAREYNNQVFLYTADSILANYYDEVYVARNKNANYFVVDFDTIDFESNKIFKFVFVNTPEEINELRNKLPKELYGDFEITSSVPQFIEVVKKDVKKSEAIQMICDKLAVDPSEVIAFGDEENDLSMIQFAGYGIAMSNASEVVKEAANFITKSNDDEGFAFAINALLSE